MPETPEVLDLEGIRARVEAATPGEWAARKDQFIDWYGIVALNGESWSVSAVPNLTRRRWWPVVSGDNDYGPAGGIVTEADAEFIAHSITDIPALLTEVERLRAEGNSIMESLQGEIVGLEGQRDWLRDFVDLLREYIEFTASANDGPIGLAHAHGWNCPEDVYERGVEYRDRIAAMSSALSTKETP